MLDVLAVFTDQVCTRRHARTRAVHESRTGVFALNMTPRKTSHLNVERQHKRSEIGEANYDEPSPPLIEWICRVEHKKHTKKNQTCEADAKDGKQNDADECLNDCELRSSAGLELLFFHLRCEAP